MNTIESVTTEKGREDDAPLTTIDETDRHRHVSEAAYFLAEQRRFAPGYELEDWLAAEREIAARTRR